MEKIIEVDVWGSCISRDALYIGGKDEGFKINYFFESIHPAPQFTQHMMQKITVNDVENYFLHNAPRKWLCNEFNKDIPEIINKSRSKWLILDVGLVRLGICKLKLKNGIYEYNSGVYSKEIMEITKRFYPTCEYIYPIQECEISTAMDDFYNFINKRYGKNIILLETSYVFKMLNESGDLSDDIKMIEYDEMKQLEMTSFLVDMVKKTNCYCIKFPYNTIADYYHKWGLSSLHYVEEYYKYAYKCIKIITNRQDVHNKLELCYYETLLQLQKIRSKEVRSINNSLNFIKENIKKDPVNTAKRIDELLSQNVPEAYYYKAQMELESQFDEYNVDNAVKHMEIAVKYNGEWTLEYIDLILYKQHDYPKALDVCLKVYDKIPNAAGRIGRMYRDGLGVEQDYSKAVEWMRKAADKNENWVPEFADLLLQKKENYKEAYDRCVAVCDKVPIAAGRIGRMYRDGLGVEQDYSKAVEWMRKAADKNENWVPEFADLLLQKKENYKEL